MSFSIILILILIILLAIYSFILLDLNNSVVYFDLVFIEIDFQLGSLILFSFCLGIIITVILELLYFFSKKKNEDA